MKCPEPTEAQNDKAYREYLEGYGRGPIGLLMMLAGLKAAGKAIEKELNKEGEGNESISN